MLLGIHIYVVIQIEDELVIKMWEIINIDIQIFFE